MIKFKRMKKIIYLLFIVVLVILYSCNNDKPQKEEITSVYFNDYLESKLNDSTYLGIIYYKASGNTDSLYIHGSASRTKKEINLETQFEIGSVTKSFTALLIAIAEEEGKLSYDDPIEKYLPNKFIVPENSTGKITIRQLITHSSGLPYMPTDIHTNNPVQQTEDYLNYTPTKLYEFLKNYKIEGIAKDSIIYSPLGFAILGYALENIYEQNYNELLKIKITEPLKMTRTGVNYQEHSDDNYANGYLGMDNVNWYRNDSCIFNTSGGLRSCMKDLIVYAKANVGIIDSPLKSAMQKTHEVQISGETPLTYSDICLGWGKYKSGFIVHFGGTMGFIAFVGFHPGNKEFQVLLANTAYNMLAVPWVLEFGSNEMNKK